MARHVQETTHLSKIQSPVFGMTWLNPLISEAHDQARIKICKTQDSSTLTRRNQDSKKVDTFGVGGVLLGVRIWISLRCGELGGLVLHVRAEEKRRHRMKLRSGLHE